MQAVNARNICRLAACILSHLMLAHGAETECRRYTNATVHPIASIPFATSGMVGTSMGHLAIVEYMKQKVAIIRTNGTLIRTFKVPGADRLLDIASQGEMLFTTANNGMIYMMKENGKFIESINTGNHSFYMLEVKDQTIWACSWNGVHEITIDGNYSLVSSKLLIPLQDDNHTFKILAIHDTMICVIANFTLHFYTLNGTALDGYGTGKGNFTYPLALETDECGHLYVADYRRILQFSPTGQFVRFLTGQSDLSGHPAALYIRNDSMFIATWSPHLKFYVAGMQ